MTEKKLISADLLDKLQFQHIGTKKQVLVYIYIYFNLETTQSDAILRARP